MRRNNKAILRRVKNRRKENLCLVENYQKAASYASFPNAILDDLKETNKVVQVLRPRIEMFITKICRKIKGTGIVIQKIGNEELNFGTVNEDILHDMTTCVLSRKIYFRDTVKKYRSKFKKSSRFNYKQWKRRKK